MSERIAKDGEEIACRAGNQDWSVAWHPPGKAPDGLRFGASGICLVDSGEAVLVSMNGVKWELPGGRPEGEETWEETFRREVLEEACATVRAARLLGFVRSHCTRGRERGRVLVRSHWVAAVTLGPWSPVHEIKHRKLIPPAQLLEHLTTDPSFFPIYRRALAEAAV